MALSRNLSVLGYSLCLALTVSYNVVAATGRTPGTFAVSPVGAASYTIPIWVPPGPHGLQPHLAIVYNSGGGVGPMGRGWAIAGLSAITRCNKTYAEDAGVAASVNLTSTDGFCLDGKRLRLYGGQYGQVGSTYQTEIADFSLITATGTQANGPTSFSVQTRDGLTYEYGVGTTNNSAVLANGTSTVLAWMLDKVTDKAQNTMTVTYLPPSQSLSGATLPDTISWTPSTSGSSSYTYTLKFNYTSNVPASSLSGYVAGTAVLDTDLLLNVKVQSLGTTVRQYVFQYGGTSPTPSPTTHAYRLTQVQECADDAASNCLQPTTIGYQDGAAGTTGGSTLQLGGSVGLPTAHYDFNGDGYADLLYVLNGTWYASLGSSSGFGTPISTGISSSDGLGLSLLCGDLQGTGKDEILANNSNTWYEYTLNGAAFSSASAQVAFDSSALGAALIDVNGDGLPDLVTLNFVSSGANYGDHITTRLNTSTSSAIGFSAPINAWNLTSGAMGQSLFAPVLVGPSALNGSLRALDFNGDGRKDLEILQVDCLFGSPCQVFQQSATTLLGQADGTFVAGGSTAAPQNSGPPSPSFANWNNDGCTDTVIYNAVLVSGCSGSGPGSLTPAGTVVGTMDWDGDGRADLIERGADGNLAIQLSTGTGLSATVTPTNIPFPSGCVVVTLDADGDGLDDLIVYCISSGSIAYYPHQQAGIVPDLVTSITDGYGNRVSASYVSLARAVASGVYQEGNDALSSANKYENYIGALQVVGSYSASDGSGNPANTYTGQLSYAKGWMSLQGLGFAGFDSKRLIDSRNGLYQYQYYKREFPYAGMVREEDLYQTNGTTLIRQTLNTLTERVLSATVGQDRHFPYASPIVVNDRELGGPDDGLQITTASTTSTFDDNGNATNVSTTVTDLDAGSPYFNLTWGSTVVTNVTADTGINWCLNQPTSVVVTNTAPGSTPPGRTVTYSPDYGHCRTQQKVVGSTSSYAVTEAYTYDAFGNIRMTTTSGLGIATRTTTTDWGSTGQFPVTITDPVAYPLGSGGYQTVNGYDPGLGLMTSQVVQSADGTMTPNAPPHRWVYDAFGRLSSETRSDGTATTWAYNDCASACVNAANKVTVTQTLLNTDHTTQTDATVYMDHLDRPLVTSKRQLSGAYDRTEVQYDAFGRIAQQAAPCAWTNCGTPYWSVNSYDRLNRITQTSRTLGDLRVQNTYVTYAGRTTTVTDPEGKQNSRILTVAGTLGRTQDHNGYYQNISYDAFGSLTSVVDSQGSALFSASYVYGAVAIPTSITDADLGARTNLVYDALGELLSYTDANSQNLSFTYDTLMRPLSRTEPGLMTTWVWGHTASAHNVGQAQSVTANSYVENYTYEAAGRLSNRSISIPSDTTYGYDYAYNVGGEIDTLTYPTSTSMYRLKLQYHYQNGFLSQVLDFNSPSTVFWSANTTNVRGQITQETLGNGVTTTRTFDPVTGWLSGVQTVLPASPQPVNVQNYSYLYDLVGDVTQRQNNTTALNEAFFYDNLHRLDHSTLGSTTNLALTYFPNGNIKSRSDVPGGTDWQYDATKIHAVKQAGSAAFSYSYDLNGNATARSGYTIQWTSFNHPLLISGAGQSVAFDYNQDHERWRAVYTGSFGTETTYFIGDLLERVVNAGVNDYRHYIYAGGTKVAIYSRTDAGSGANTLRYVREDHEGSADALISPDGTIVKESFTPYGLTRSSCTWSGPPTSGTLAKAEAVTRHGYTWQTALGEMGLNDMNGRIEDAVTGRFLSPDPYISDPTSTQNYNRYSYVNNNPLTLVDPSGFDACVIIDVDRYDGDTVTQNPDGSVNIAPHHSRGYQMVCVPDGSSQITYPPYDQPPVTYNPTPPPPVNPPLPPPIRLPPWAFTEWMCNTASKLKPSEETTLAAADTAATAIDNTGRVLPGVDPTLAPAGRAITDIAAPVANGISALHVATNIHNGKYADAAFGTIDAFLTIIAVAKGGTGGAAGAGAANVAGGTKAASAGALGVGCLITGGQIPATPPE